MSPATYIDHHSTTPNHKYIYGRRAVKGLTYRVKSSSPSPSPVEETSEEHHVVVVPQRSCIVSIGKSPSYKEVALAPPGSISLLQIRDDIIPDDKEIDNGQHKSEQVSDKVEGGYTKEEKTEAKTEESCEESSEGANKIEIVDKSVIDIPIPTPTPTPTPETEYVKPGDESPNSSNQQQNPNKRLSASATPFNPSLPSPPVRASAMNVALPPITVPPAPWHIPSSPNMMHPIIYSPPPSLPNTTTYPITTANHFAWANGLQYVTGPVWSNCHPMEYSVPPPAVRPPVSEGNNHNHVDQSKENVSVDAQKPVQRVENDRTFNILIRGRRNRKQTLRMPISLLNKPYNSQSFKVIYSRLIRGTEASKSSQRNGTATATAT